MTTTTRTTQTRQSFRNLKEILGKQTRDLREVILEESIDVTGCHMDLKVIKCLQNVAAETSLTAITKLFSRT